jgi:hypothetical protein
MTRPIIDTLRRMPLPAPRTSLHACASALRIVLARRLAHHPRASALRVRFARRPCASASPVSFARRPCASALRVGLARRPCASALRVGRAVSPRPHGSAPTKRMIKSCRGGHTPQQLSVIMDFLDALSGAGPWRKCAEPMCKDPRRENAVPWRLWPKIALRGTSVPSDGHHHDNPLPRSAILPGSQSSCYQDHEFRLVPPQRLIWNGESRVAVATVHDKIRSSCDGRGHHRLP